MPTRKQPLLKTPIPKTRHHTIPVHRNGMRQDWDKYLRGMEKPGRTQKCHQTVGIQQPRGVGHVQKDRNTMEPCREGRERRAGKERKQKWK